MDLTPSRYKAIRLSYKIMRYTAAVFITFILITLLTMGIIYMQKSKIDKLNKLNKQLETKKAELKINGSKLQELTITLQNLQNAPPENNNNIGYDKTSVYSVLTNLVHNIGNNIIIYDVVNDGPTRFKITGTSSTMQDIANTAKLLESTAVNRVAISTIEKIYSRELNIHYYAFELTLDKR